ncbi:MAG: ABC transporter ATP-binding protein [Betaproteobacteria bacterium]|nr:MAG: ABC transporter ATP-binding protein [Betaproteobacteria bacterium]
MSNIAIEAEGLGKRYTLGGEKGYRAFRDVLAELPLLATGKQRHVDKKVLWALKDVSFSIPEGQVVGIIGRNGSGKSTLLKLLSRITDPTEGRAKVRGRVGALLEVGTGFHPELTGRENIYVNGAILGMTRREINSKFDAIVDFSGVEEFLDTPVKRYSSGMRVRLAFAVAAHLEPEILVVDEVLAVGDAVFQRKCLGRMQDVATEGRTVLIVSHQLEMIQNFCSRAIWLNGGQVAADGEANAVVGEYLHSVFDTALSVDLASRSDRSGSGLARVISVSLSRKGCAIPAAVTGQSLDLHFDYAGGNNLPTLQLLAELKNESGIRVVGFFTHATGQDFVDAPTRGRLTCHVPRLNLEHGRYTISIAMRVGRELVDRVDAAAVIEVLPGDFFGSGFDARRLGPVLCDHSWSMDESPSPV